MSVGKQLSVALLALKNKNRAQKSEIFFKTGPGQYGEHDCFLGISMPDIRRITNMHVKDMDLDSSLVLLDSTWHEIRMAGALCLNWLYDNSQSLKVKKSIFTAYNRYTGNGMGKRGPGINNWDLVDVSASHIVGAYTWESHDMRALHELCKNHDLWKRRVGIVATSYWIRQGNSVATFTCAELLMNDSEDLIHKATGWMLREVGKRISKEVLRDFLQKHATHMPRTALRYAIEHFSQSERKQWLQKC